MAASGVDGTSGSTMTGPSSPWANITTLTANAKQATDGWTVAVTAGYQITSSTGAATYAGTSSSAPYGAAVATFLPGGAAFVAGQPKVVGQAVKRASFY
jgi:hypothetical protein